jgi:hypothetical protein
MPQRVVVSQERALPTLCREHRLCNGSWIPHHKMTFWRKAALWSGSRAALDDPDASKKVDA